MPSYQTLLLEFPYSVVLPMFLAADPPAVTNTLGSACNLKFCFPDSATQLTRCNQFWPHTPSPGLCPPASPTPSSPHLGCRHHLQGWPEECSLQGMGGGGPGGRGAHLWGEHYCMCAHLRWKMAASSLAIAIAPQLTPSVLLRPLILQVYIMLSFATAH